MEKSSNDDDRDTLEWQDYSRKDTEELILLYLEDYYTSLDDYYLKEAFQIAKDEGIDIQKMLQRAKSRLH